MARGGRRQGIPGTAYPNRSDLNVNKQLPVQAPTGMPYGARKATEDAQKVVPLAPPPTAAVAAPPSSPVSIAPGELPPLSAPTARPNEPLTAGLPIGPGPGPTPMPQSVDTVGALLDSLSVQGNPDIVRLAQYLQSGRR
jgi:hypothetical protein